MREQDAVRHFHEVFGVGISEEPELPPGRLALRLALMDEELAEVREAIASGDVIKVAKELADLLYVTFGAGVEFGIPLHDVFTEVHRSNMSKLWSVSAATVAVADPDHEAASLEVITQSVVVRRADGKVLKPPTYQAPDIAALLG